MAVALPLNELAVIDSANPPSPETNFPAGSIILCNKEKGWTSFDLVRFVRNRVGIKKVGHAGTLDPMATGLLIICTGKATKSISQIQDLKKTYLAEITFGSSTPTYDAESEADQEAPSVHIGLSDIQKELEKSFSGDIMQVPPMYSALKRDGKRLYDLARRGETVELQPRPVTIYQARIISWNHPVLSVEIECSKGTYIRSIAHDLGIALKSRAHLSALERTATGPYLNSNALTKDQIEHHLPQNG